MEVGRSGVPAGESLRARGLKGSSEFLEPRTVSVPVSAIPQEGKVIDTSVPAPSSTGYSHARNRAMTSPAPGRTASPMEPSSPKGLHLGHFANPWESTRRRDTTSKLRRTLSAARSRRPRDVGGPYRESHIKKFRDQVMDAREGLSDDERVLLLVRENNECKADLREKKEQIKKLEVTVRSLRAQLARGATKVDNSFVKDENIITDLNVNVNVNVARLVNENNDLEKRLREANAQIVIWKRDARVAHLTELKTELAVYKAEVARLSSLTHGGRVRHLQNDSAESRLREAFGLAKEKDDIIQQLKEKLSENAASLGRSLENAMRVQSAADQLQEENEALCKELHILRKASIELTHTRGELGCTRADLKEARQRLEEFRRLMKDVGSPAEVFAVVRERDALLDMLKEQTLREEAQRLEFTRQQIDARKGMEDCIQEERSLENDKVVQLQQTCMMWNERHDRLALESAAERERFEKELQVLKELHEERHQELRLLLDRMESNPNFGKQSEVAQLQENMNLQIEEAPVATLKTRSQKQVLSTSSMSLTKSPFIESHCAKDFNADRKPSREANQEQNSQLIDTSRREEMNSASSTQNNNHVGESYRSGLVKYPHDLQTPAISTGEAQEGEPSTSPSKRFSPLSAMNSFIGTTGVKKFAINCDASDASLTTGNSVELTSLSNYNDNSLPKTGGVSILAVMNDLGSMSRDSSTIRVHVPPPPPAAVPAPPAASTTTTVDSGNPDSEKDLPIRVHVPPPPPAAVPAPPAASTTTTVDSGNSDSEKDLPIRVHVLPPPPAAVPAPPAASTTTTVDSGNSDSEKDLPIRVHVPPPPPAAVPAPPAASTTTTVDSGNSDSKKDLPIRVHVPPPPPAAVPAPPAASTTTTVDSGNSDSEKDLPIRVHVPPPPPAAVPAPPAASTTTTVDSGNSDSEKDLPIRVHVPPPPPAAVPAPPAASTTTTVDSGNSDSEKDLPIRVHVPPPPPAAVPAPPAASTTTTVDSGNSDSEKDLPIRVHVPPPPPAAVPAPPAASTTTTVDSGNSDSEKDLPIRVHASPSPQHDGDGVENTYELVSPVPTCKLSSCSVGTSAHGDLRHRNRYEKEDVWGTASTCEEDESFNVHYVES